MIIFGSSLVVGNGTTHPVLILSFLRNLLHEQLGHQFWSQNNEIELHLKNESKDGFLEISSCSFESTSIFYFRFRAVY